MLEDGELNVNVTWNNETVLTQAVKVGNLHIMERLLAEEKIDFNARDRNGSLEDVQFALDFINHGFMEQVRVLHDSPGFINSSASATRFEKLAEQEEKLEDKLLG